ncbi:MAG: NADH-quinone oxidoreductase subunit NuoB [Anaerolineae bacterium CFX3]|nr:NADH-quinone oxidoreductase subunit B family protein [Anaerolineales bacterium]MCE7905825.1 NADH-quinone oxidoreductase subunit NuoB [Anaerolineae bacterium CFX3]MCQ3946987.1 hydrogenase [Anaerolineae bacterium]MCZ2288802.1 NADH-quinone oxidoreductase subunit B family protein [Anaerolineales bacterium]RIK25024.1 MAG: hydrogenase [Anaerolineae bacterium]
MDDYNIKTDTAFAVRPDEATDKLKGVLLKDIQRSCYVYRVDCGGCNGCEIEIFAAITPIFDAERFGIKVVSSPRHADVLVYTGAVTRSMRVPALRAYHAAPNPKVCVAYGACGCSGGIFHDLYCVWGGADKILPIDMYIPGCPPTPLATIHGFAVALGLLKQKMQMVHHVQGEDERSQLLFPEVPLELRVDVERESRRMAGYWAGRNIANIFLGLIKERSPKEAVAEVDAYLRGQDDPRLAEIMRRLEEIFLSRTSL